MSEPIRIQVLLFAMLAEAASLREVELEFPAQTTVRQVVDHLLQTFPRLQSTPMDHVFFAVNHKYAPAETVLKNGDELALIPPVSGGDGGAPTEAPSSDGGSTGPTPSDGGVTEASSPDGRFLVTAAPLRLDAASELVGGSQIGGRCVFVGTVRAITGERHTSHLFYEAYPDMVIAEMERIAADLHSHWPDVEVAMHHRIGRLTVGEIAVVIAAAAPHRDSAFAASRFGIDEVKHRCPIWKKEIYTNGTMEWVAPGVDPGEAPGEVR